MSEGAAEVDPALSGPGGSPGVTVLWRPGCGFCRILFAGLERHGVAHSTVNIWEDAGARSMLNDRIGSETVPTVLIGDAVLVNPSITDLLERLGS